MKKVLKIILIFVLLFTGHFAFGQDSVAVLPKDVALFYRERHEKAKMQAKQLSLKDSIIESQEKTISTYLEYVEVQKVDSIAMMGMVESQKITIDTYKRGEEFQKERANKFKKQRNGVTIIGVVIIVLLLL